MPEFAPDVEAVTVAAIVAACERLEWYGEICDVVYVPGSTSLDGPVVVRGRHVAISWAPSKRAMIVMVSGGHFGLDGEAI